MPDISEFIPIVQTTIAEIRARLDADVNAGLSTTDERYVDTTEGGIYWDLTQVLALEIERLWDFLGVEVPAAVMVPFSWGAYLDDLGETVGVDRKDATFASGEVTFTGTNGTVVPLGTVVSTVSASADVDPQTYVVTDGGTVAGGTLVVNVLAEEAGVAGNTALGTVTILLSPVPGISAVSNVAAITGGSDVESDAAYRERVLTAYRATPGAGTRSDYEAWALEYEGVSYAVAIAEAFGAGTVRVVISDANRQAVPNAVRDGLQALLDPYQAQTAINNGAGYALPAGTLTVDSTTGFDTAGRIYADNSVGATQVVNYTGKTGTTFTGCTGGTGTLADNAVVSQSGKGEGRAPVGAIVQVRTPTAVPIDVQVTMTYKTGYSESGTGGTLGIDADIIAAIGDYVNSLGAGDDVILNHVAATFFDVEGVQDIASLQIRRDAVAFAAANLVLLDSEIAVLDAVTLN